VESSAQSEKSTCRRHHSEEFNVRFFRPEAIVIIVKRFLENSRKFGSSKGLDYEE
jgi:hypothetical protein